MVLKNRTGGKMQNLWLVFTRKVLWEIEGEKDKVC